VVHERYGRPLLMLLRVNFVKRILLVPVQVGWGQYVPLWGFGGEAEG
jgi:hypothetical protein